MNKNNKGNTIFSYLILALLCAISLLSLVGWLMYLFDIRSRIFYESIGIATSFAIAIILYIGIGIKGILYCISYSCICVGALSTLASFFFKTINTYHTITVFLIGLSVYFLRSLIYKGNANKSLHRTAEPLCDLEDKEKK
jgi:hypothetical protein